MEQFHRKLVELWGEEKNSYCNFASKLQLLRFLLFNCSYLLGSTLDLGKSSESGDEINARNKPFCLNFKLCSFSRARKKERLKDFHRFLKDTKLSFILTITITITTYITQINWSNFSLIITQMVWKTLTET